MDGKRLRTSLRENLVSRRLKIKKLFYRWWWVILFGLTFLLRLPSLFEPFTYGDEGIYLTLGQAFGKGLVWYRDIHDNKPPFLYLLAALAGSFSYYRLILFVWSFATIFMFFKLALFFFSKRKPAVMATTTLFAILTSLHTFEGNVGNAENFMLLSIIAGFYLYLMANKWHHYFLVGILFSFATLFKVPAAFDFAALIVLSLLLFLSQKRRNYSLFIIHYSLFIFGFLLPILTTFVYFASKNAFSQYFTAAFFQNLPYLASWSPDKPKITGLPLPLLSRAGLVFLIYTAVFVFRKKLSLAAKLVLIWFSFSLFAALLSSRPYPHYLLQAMPALALSFGLLLAKTKEKIIPIVLSFSLAFSFLYFKFWHYPNISYYQNFYQFVLHQKSKESYFNYFGSQTQSLYQTAEYLKSHTLPEEKIFIWSNQPSIYALANRLPVDRYTVAYHIIDFNGYQETMNALSKNPPRYIVISKEEQRPFPALFALIQTHYAKRTEIGDFEIFRQIH